MPGFRHEFHARRLKSSPWGQGRADARILSAFGELLRVGPVKVISEPVCVGQRLRRTPVQLEVAVSLLLNLNPIVAGEITIKKTED